MSQGLILIIEDDPGIRTLLKFQLETGGYAVLEAEDGRQGLAVLDRAMPDLVITDLMMPELDGHEVCRHIKSHFRTGHIPVIMLTARADMPSRVESLGDGANDYLTKPYDRTEMLLRVRNLINWSRTQREANPLTGLPGNVAIEKEVTRRLAAGQPFLFLYVDIDNFKAFNDSYGYARGDDVIRLLSQIIADAVSRFGHGDAFVGHVGGDDFVVMTTPEVMQPVTRAIITTFDRVSREYYSEDHRRAGQVQVANRHGQLDTFPLMSLTIAAVPSDRYQIGHSAQLNDLATELKRYGKSLPGSVVVHERRGQFKPMIRSGTDG